MACMNITRKSGFLRKETQLRILVPNGVEKQPMKVLYLLHGLSDDSSCWTRFTGLELFVREEEVVIVMPDGGRSFYNDTPYDENYFQYLTKELPKWIQFLFPVSNKLEDTFIAGMSMGGYGVLKAALTYPEQYGGVAALSSVCDVRRHYDDASLPVKAAFGDTPDWSALDLFELAKKQSRQKTSQKFINGAVLPTFYIRIIKNFKPLWNI